MNAPFLIWELHERMVARLLCGWRKLRSEKRSQSERAYTQSRLRERQRPYLVSFLCFARCGIIES